MKRYSIIAIIGALGLLVWLWPDDFDKKQEEVLGEFQGEWNMKLVNEDVSDADLDQIKNLGVTVVSGEWGMADAGADAVLKLLDRVQVRGMKLIINFSDGSAWGYREDGTDARSKRPVWQKRKVQRYLRQIKHHPAIYGYDISNEAGENLPNGDRMRISLTQMREAAKTVRDLAPGKPVILRMHYWDEADGDFGKTNPFAAGIADIVMLNLYSNYQSDEQTALLPNMLRDSGQILVNKILRVDPQAKVWISLAAFHEGPMFIRPTAGDLKRDLAGTLVLQNVFGIGFFGWGPERYPEEPPGWYLPRDGANLLEVIRH